MVTTAVSCVSHSGGAPKTARESPAEGSQQSCAMRHSQPACVQFVQCVAGPRRSNCCAQPTRTEVAYRRHEQMRQQGRAQRRWHQQDLKGQASCQGEGWALSPRSWLVKNGLRCYDQGSERGQQRSCCCCLPQPTYTGTCSWQSSSPAGAPFRTTGYGASRPRHPAKAARPSPRNSTIPCIKCSSNREQPRRRHRRQR